MNSINSTCDSWSPRWYENSSSLEYIVYCFLTEHWFTINISSKAPPSPCYNPDVHVFNGVITLAIVKQFGKEKKEFLIPIISNGLEDGNLNFLQYPLSDLSDCSAIRFSPASCLNTMFLTIFRLESLTLPVYPTTRNLHPSG